MVKLIKSKNYEHFKGYTPKVMLQEIKKMTNKKVMAIILNEG